MENNPYKLYLVTDQTHIASEDKFLSIIEEACQAGVTMVQLREKNLDSLDYYRLGLAVKKITDTHQVPLIIDDRLDICLAVDAHGLHIGDKDLPVALARRLLGPDKVLGVSAKSVDRALEAQSQGADYLGVGAIYPTQTKVVTQQTSFETLKTITHKVNLPVVAIGGIKERHLPNFKGSGIAGLAMVSEIMQAESVQEKVSHLRQYIDKELQV